MTLEILSSNFKGWSAGVFSLTLRIFCFRIFSSLLNKSFS